MNEQEKPLHVRVAEKLGCKSCYDSWWAAPFLDATSGWLCGCGTDSPWPHNGCDTPRMARYDSDWSATGPLIERLGIELAREGSDLWEARWGYSMVPSFCDDGDGGPEWVGTAEGTTPLLAVCALILALPDEVVREGSK